MFEARLNAKVRSENDNQTHLFKKGAKAAPN